MSPIKTETVRIRLVHPRGYTPVWLARIPLTELSDGTRLMGELGVSPDADDAVEVPRWLVPDVLSRLAQEVTTRTAEVVA